MKLDTITPQDIIFGQAPIDQLLKDSVYYPACYTDGRPIKYCNTIWRSLGVNSFVYCDFMLKESEFLAQMHTLYGYHVLAHRSLLPHEYLVQGWEPELSPADQGHYRDSFLGNGSTRPFAHWVVYERNADKGPLHGPERLSLLYVGGEGLSIFQQLYVSRHIAPKMVCFIQCWGFAGNWTDFTSPLGSFAHTMRNHPECLPEWVCMGATDRIEGVQRLRNTEYLGIKCIGYGADGEHAQLLGGKGVTVCSRPERHVTIYQGDGRCYLALSVMPHLAPVLYEMTGASLDVETIVDSLILRERRGASQNSLLNGWVGLRDDMTLDLTLRDRSLHPYANVSDAANMVAVLERFYSENEVGIVTQGVMDALWNAIERLSRFPDDAIAKGWLTRATSLRSRLRSCCTLIPRIV